MDGFAQIALLPFTIARIGEQTDQAGRDQVGSAALLQEFRDGLALQQKIYECHKWHANQRAHQGGREPADAVGNRHRHAGKR
jgi:hypothetical protein